jgi:hypothetical protein
VVRGLLVISDRGLIVSGDGTTVRVMCGALIIRDRGLRVWSEGTSDEWGGRGVTVSKGKK